MDPFNISYAGALGAGLLSFFSPCILPIVPAYISYLAGASLDQLIGEDDVDKQLSRRVFYSALSFVIGFGTVFVLLGASATLISDFIAGNINVLGKIAGVIIALFGLHFMGVFRIGFLNFEKRMHIEKKPSGLVGSYVLGLAFAFGWTPCVGPILATILMIASSNDSIWQGVGLLSSYAVGIGVPFLFAAAFVKPFMRFMAKFRRHMHKIEIAIGLLLIVTGIAIFTGTIAEASNWLLETFPIFNKVG